MKRIFKNQRGAVLITFAILLMVLLGFAALATEAGRWYLVRSELSKAADAAALAGVKNISNPNVTVETIAKEIGDENFPAGQLGTPGSGEEGSITFTTTKPESNKIQVLGQVSAIAFLARLFGISQVATSSLGVAQKKEVEIMMVLDRSGSMDGTPINDLKTASKSFLGFFKETEDKDRMGLITFATGVSVDHSLSTNFVNDMTAKINAISAHYSGIADKRQHTNAEDAIDRSQAMGGFTNQSGLPEDQRVQQYLIFFTDGNPNAFRDHFTYQGIDYDAVAYATWVTFDGNCDGLICRINPFGPSYLCDRDTGDTLLPPGLPGIPALPTGDGATSSTKWNVFGEYPVPGYGPNDNIPETILKPVWFKNVVRQKAINHAQELKNNRIKIYTIGLGQVDKAFLSQIASGPGFEYYAPSSDQLEAIFQEIAKDIRLRLVA